MWINRNAKIEKLVKKLTFNPAGILIYFFGTYRKKFNRVFWVAYSLFNCHNYVCICDKNKD